MNALFLNAALKGTLLLAVAWTAAAILRRSSADLRHRVWLAAMFGFVLLLIPAPVPEAARVTIAYTFSADAVASSATNSVPLWPVIWAVGTALLLLRYLAGIVHLAGLTRNARPTENPGVRISDRVSSPLTWGALRPAILLPAYASLWPQEKLRLALEHERAHIARGDWFWQSFAQLMTAVFWFHPMVWIAAARLRQEAEQAVDDAVLNSGAEAAGYAEQLLEVAKHVRAVSPAVAVAMVCRPALTARVAAILDVTRSRARAGLRSRVAIALAAACLVPLLAAFQSAPRSVAETFVPPAVSFALEPVPQAVPEPAPSRPARTEPITPIQEPQSEAVAEETAQAGNPEPQGQEPLPIGGGVSAPVPIYKTEPQYTEEARVNKVQGEVMLEVIIDESGVPASIQITRGIGAGLDQQAIIAIQQWRFKPGMKDGVPVRVKAVISMQFKLL